jgi:hypothetical protein
VQGHERFLKIGQRIGPACADHGPHQFIGGSGQSEIRLGRNGRPLRVMPSRALMPFLVQVGEQPGRGVEPAHRACARRRHMDMEDFRERRLADEKRSGGQRHMATADLFGARRISGGRGLARELSELAVEFPGYEFATQQTWDGTSIAARRHGGTRPGLHAVVTGDLDEMRRTLLESEAARSPGLTDASPEGAVDE